MGQTSHPGILLALHTAYLVEGPLPRQLIESLASGTSRRGHCLTLHLGSDRWK